MHPRKAVPGLKHAPIVQGLNKPSSPQLMQLTPTEAHAVDVAVGVITTLGDAVLIAPTDACALFVAVVRTDDREVV